MRKSPNDPANANQITDINSIYLNINRRAHARLRSADWTTSNDFSFGKLTADLQVTYTMSDVAQLFDTAAASGLIASEQVGYIGRPKTVGVADISLKRGDWTYAWRGNYVSTTRELDLSNVYTYLGYQGATRDIKAGWQLRSDISVAYSPSNWGIMVGVRNVFDMQPDLISTGVSNVVGNTPLLASQYDWYGRTFFARVNYKF